MGRAQKFNTEEQSQVKTAYRYIYSVTKEGQTEILYKNMTTTFSFYLQHQNDTQPLLRDVFGF